MLSFNGRTIAESVRMLLPPAVVEKASPFLKYHSDCVEPWDGPAAIAFSDGVVVGAALDRNGLRPCRYAITSDGLVVAGSEAGLVDLDPEMLIESGRLGLLLTCLARHRRRGLSGDPQIAGNQAQDNGKKKACHPSQRVTGYSFQIA